MWWCPRSVRAGLGQARLLLVPAHVIASPETRLRYRIQELLGQGGFGQVYLARRLGLSAVARVVWGFLGVRVRQ